MSEKDNKDIDVENNESKDSDLQDGNQTFLSKRRKDILSIVAILVIFVLLLNYFSGSKNNRFEGKNYDGADAYSDPNLEKRLEAQFAALDKQNIKYIKSVNKESAPVEKAPIVPKADPKLEGLMKAELKPNLNDTHKQAELLNSKRLVQPNMPSNDGYGNFANAQPTDVTTITANKLKHTDYLMAQGELLHGVLNTAISSEIQGDVTGTITEPGYSYTGRNILIPVGSRLVGSYAMANMGNGMAATRIFIIWNRIITPWGISIMINSPGKDSLGITGTAADVVDRHFFLMFGTSTLLTVIGAGAANFTSGANVNGQSAQQGYLQSVQQSFANTSNSVLGKFTNIDPTLYADQGKEISIYLNKDLDMYGAYN